MRWFAKPMYVKAYRGFESPTLRIIIIMGNLKQILEFIYWCSQRTPNATNEEIMLTLITISIAIIAAITTIFGTVFAFKQLTLKSGQKVRGSFNLNKSPYGDDYIPMIIIENQKDKAIVIDMIFLKLGHNNYLILETFNMPLVINSWGVYKKEFEQPTFYLNGSRLFDLKKIFRLKRKLVLSTTDGKLVVKENRKKWSLSREQMENESTNIFNVMGHPATDKSFGSNVVYLVDILYMDNKEEIIQIYDGCTQMGNIKLPPESLVSAKTLEEFVNKDLKSQKIRVKELHVIDFKADVDEIKKKYGEPILVEPMGYFKYRLIGRFKTIISNWRLKINNKLNKTMKFKLYMNNEVDVAEFLNDEKPKK